MRKHEPWASGFGSVSTTTVSGYVEALQSLQAYEGLDREYLAQFGDGDFIYSFTSKANVSAELGRYSYCLKGVCYNNVEHRAIDLLTSPYPNNCGVPIYAVYDGEIVGHQSSNISVTGNYGVVKNGDITVKYYHMQSAFPYEVGTIISKGDYIGLIGSTGQSTGCHLHLQIEVNGIPVNPRLFIDFDNPFGE